MPVINFKSDNSFPVYIETKNKIYIPKMYAINNFGLPENLLDNYNGKEWDTPLEFKGSLYDNQKEPADNSTEF